MPESSALLRRALTLSSLTAAFAKVKENDGAAGCDGQTIAQFAAGLESRLRALQREVLEGTYRPVPLLRCWLPRSNKSPRGLAIPAVRDRVLQTAVAKVLNPIFEAEFEDCSFAYRQGRSVRQAVERIGVLQRQGYCWIVDADIEAFFDRIPHAPLLQAVAKVAPDRALLALIKTWLSASIVDGAERHAMTIGVPQGSPISPLLANLYLDHLDEALLDEDFALVRYADDFIVLTRNREKAEDALELTQEVLRRLQLKINPLKTRIVSFEQGFEFLGWNFVRSLAVPSRWRNDEASKSAEPAGRASGNDNLPVPQPQPAVRGTMQDSLMRALQARPEWKPTLATNESLPEECEDIPPEIEPADNVNGKSEDNGPAAVETIATPARLETGPDVATKILPSASDADEGHFLSEDLTDHARGEHSFPAPGPIQRTLYLVDQGAELAKEGERLIVRKDGKPVLELPAINVDQVMVFGNNVLTTPAMQLCMRHRIPIALLSRLGRYYGRLDAADLSSVALLRAQTQASSAPELVVNIARACVHGKLENSALVLARYARRHGGEAIAKTASKLREQARHLKSATTLDELRGMEGSGAGAYFLAWQRLLDKSWGFAGRKRRPPPDPVNVLLSLGYTLLYHCIAGLIQARGLNPHVGFLHLGDSRHLALASDLMEEFRAVTVDAIVLNLCLNGKVTPEHFQTNTEGCTLSREGARVFIRAFETKLNSELQHPVNGSRFDVRRIMDSQVLLLVRVLRSPDTVVYRACEFR